MKLDLNNLYGAWFNIMTQQKVGRQFGVQIYTRSLRPESYELFKIALFSTTHMGHSRKNQHIGPRMWTVCPSVDEKYLQVKAQMNSKMARVHIDKKAFISSGFSWSNNFGL